MSEEASTRIILYALQGWAYVQCLAVGLGLGALIQFREYQVRFGAGQRKLDELLVDYADYKKERAEQIEYAKSRRKPPKNKSGSGIVQVRD